MMRVVAYSLQIVAREQIAWLALVLIRLLHRQLLQTMQAACNSLDDVTQPLAAKRLEQQSYFASATMLKCRNYESMTLDKLRLLCGAAHNNNIKTRSKEVDGKLVSKAKKDLILELQEADTMRLATTQIQWKLSKFFKPLATQNAAASSNDYGSASLDFDSIIEIQDVPDRSPSSDATRVRKRSASPSFESKSQNSAASGNAKVEIDERSQLQ